MNLSQVQEIVKLGYSGKNITGKTQELAQYYLLCDIQKWLREEKSIHVLVQHGTNPNNYYPEIDNISHLHNPPMWGDTYEEALELGLIEALKLIDK